MKSKLIAKIAKSNKRLSNDHYKQMIKNSALILNKTTIKVFKEAYHSKDTPADYRIMLLTSLYHDNPNLVNLIKRHVKIPTNTTKITLLPQTGLDGKKHFELVGIRKPELTQHGIFTSKQPYKIKLTTQLKEHIRSGEPTNLRQRLLNKALLSNNVQFQKITVAMQNISRCLFDLAKLTKLFAYWNDPLGIFNTSPTDEQKREGKEAAETGYYRDSAKIYMKDQDHTFKELEKYMPILEKMGIDTLPVRLEYSEIQSKIAEFIERRVTGDSQKEVTSLYDLHNASTTFIESVLDMAQQVENITEYSPEIYNIKALENIPAYVPYRRTQSVVTRSQKAVESEEGAVGEIEDVLDMLKRL